MDGYPQGIPGLAGCSKTAISPPSSQAALCGVALFMPQRVLRLRGACCGCNDLTVFEQPGFSQQPFSYFDSGPGSNSVTAAEGRSKGRCRRAALPVRLWIAAVGPPRV